MQQSSYYNTNTALIIHTAPIYFANNTFPPPLIEDPFGLAASIVYIKSNCSYARLLLLVVRCCDGCGCSVGEADGGCCLCLTTLLDLDFAAVVVTVAGTQEMQNQSPSGMSEMPSSSTKNSLSHLQYRNK